MNKFIQDKVGNDVCDVQTCKEVYECIRKYERLAIADCRRGRCPTKRIGGSD